MNYNQKKKEISYWSKELNNKGLITARNGNISCKAEQERILVTAHDSYLGHLDYKDIILTDLEGKVLKGKKTPTSEMLLHTDIYKRFKDVEVIVHAHPVYATAFFSHYKKLEIFSFESELYLKKLGVIPQDGINVTDTGPVLSALEDNCIVVLKNHGVVSVGKDFKSAFGLIELLEAQAKVNLILRSK